MSKWNVIHKVSGKVVLTLDFHTYDAACEWLAEFDCACHYTLERI